MSHSMQVAEKTLPGSATNQQEALLQLDQVTVNFDGFILFDRIQIHNERLSIIIL